MKIYKYFIIGIAFLATSFAVFAQNDGTTYNSAGGVSTAKNVTGPDDDGYYTIKLETFATGTSALTETGIPVDIVLVLDVSGSMDEPLKYNARPSQSYSYTSYGNNTYYYYYNGDYYPVERVSSGIITRYYLRFTYNNNYYYLQNNGVTQNPGNGPRQAGGTIWTGVLYEADETKMAALKSAVETFVREVNHNALYDTDGQLRGTALTNRISIVKFANDVYYGSESSITPGNNTGTIGSDSGFGNGQTWANCNYTQVRIGFTDVSTTNGVNTVIQAVNSLQPGGGTAAHYGMKKAEYLLADIDASRESNKVVVLFTDGIPGMSGWDGDFANGAISSANKIKKATDQDGYGATVFTIGVFDNLGSDDATNVNNYMNYVSSNYPDASSMTSPGTGSDQGYYQNASNADLDTIFKDIASSASQSEGSFGSATQVRDVVSSSFVLPTNTDPSDITVYTMTITENGSGWADRDDLTTTGNSPEVTVVISNNVCSDGETRRMLSVEGFDFSLDDTKDSNGFTTRANAGNWVGQRYKSKTETFWAGKKLVIEFKVLANGEATGGDGSNTNHPDSGVYVYNEETGKYSNVNHYPVPHTNLPLILKIQKDGLRHGESATFEIHRAEPLKQQKTDSSGNKLYFAVDDTGNPTSTETTTVTAYPIMEIQYNAIGKPMPDMSTDGNWSKVILTNKGSDGDVVTKVLMALDPQYIYSIIEDDWGWTYELTGESSTLTTSDVEVNPFIFHNKVKSGVVKHAEAVSINHFATSGTANDSSVENYQSTKVESFTGYTGGSGSGGSKRK